MADIAVDCSSQIEPVAAPPNQVAAGEPRAHGLRQPGGGGVRLLDLFGVGEFAEIHLGEIVGPRGAFHAPLPVEVAVGAVGGRNLVRRRVTPGAKFGAVARQVLQRWVVGRLRGANRSRTRTDAPAEPERIENAIEAFPVGFARREQMLERRAQQAHLCNVASRHQRRRVLAFSVTDGKAVVTQDPEKGREFRRDEAGNFVHFVEVRRSATAAHATFPSKRSVTSRLIRALSSWVLSRHIRVVWTSSGASWRSRTSSPTKAAAQSSVSATPG